MIGVALIVIYIILGVLYESLIHPITILSTLPSAGIGALLLLMAVHMDLSVIAIIGIILLIGIVKKNGIMLVDFALEQQRWHTLSPRDAIYQACTVRFRPILMTQAAGGYRCEEAGSEAAGQTQDRQALGPQPYPQGYYGYQGYGYPQQYSQRRMQVAQQPRLGFFW